MPIGFNSIPDAKSMGLYVIKAMKMSACELERIRYGIPLLSVIIPVDRLKTSIIINIIADMAFRFIPIRENNDNMRGLLMIFR